MAGLSVALVAVPQSLAYAELAGLPPQYGLYASAVPSILAALFVSSKYLQTGPVALTSLLSFGALSAVAEPFSADYIRLAALLALLVGALRLAFGVLRLGRISYLLSDPVLTGFTTGAAILIVSSQLPKVFDAEQPGRGVLQGAAAALVAVGDWRPTALAFTIGAGAVILVGRRVHPLFPGVLVAVVGSALVSALVDYGGATIGELDGGVFPPFGVDFAWGEAPALLVPALAIALVGFAEPASIARTFAAAERLPWDSNKEMFGQGVANVAAAISGAFPVGGSFSRSSLNRMAGARSPWAGAITGGFVLLALPLAPLLAPLPTAVLGTVVILAVVNLIRVRPVVALVRQSAPQAIVALGTLGATLGFAPRVERGVLVGVGLAVAVHLYREVSTVTVDSAPEGDTLRVRPRGVIWFATVPEVDHQVRSELAGHREIARVLVDLSGVGRLDYTGAAALARLAEELADTGVVVEITGVPPGAIRAVRIHLQQFQGRPGR